MLSDRCIPQFVFRVSVWHSIFFFFLKAGEEVETGQPLADILDPYEGDILETLYAPSNRVAFVCIMNL